MRLDAQIHRARTAVTCIRLDAAMHLVIDRGGFYVATGDYIATEGQQGQRTRLYMNAVAAYRAADREQMYTLGEYTELVTVNHRPLTRHRRAHL